MRSLAKVAFLLLRIGVLLVALALAAGYFGRLHPALDSFSHFRIHLAVLLAAAGLALLAGRFWLEGALAAAMSLVALSALHGIIPGLGPIEARLAPKPDDRPVYRLLQMNLRHDNTQFGKVLSLIAREGPDVITLQEAYISWREKIDLLSGTYPYSLRCSEEIILLSLRPFAEDSEPECIGDSFAVARIDFGGRIADIAAVHLTRPWPVGQAAQAQDLALGPVAALGPTAILAGDFNAAPWSATVRGIEAAGGLRSVPYMGATWIDRRLPDALRFAGLPIDQILTKGDIVVHSARTLEPAGSDHLPLLMEFSFLPRPPSGSSSQTATASLIRR